jgi:hypothetical protein
MVFKYKEINMNRDKKFALALREVKTYVWNEMPEATLSFVGLFGSQNYNLDNEDSDIDLKAVVFLSMEDVIRNRKLSKVVDFYFGKVTFKDAWSFLKEASKGSPNTLEAINSEWSRWYTYTLLSTKGFKVNKSALAGLFNAHLKKYRKKPFKGGYHIYRTHHLLKLGAASYYYNEDFNVPPVSKSDKEFLLGVKEGAFLYSAAQLDALEGSVDRIMKGYKYKVDKELVDDVVKLIKEWYIFDKQKLG